MLQPQQQRVLDERFALNEKILKLETFTHTQLFESLPEVERNDLMEQLQVMTQYSNILSNRIARF